MEDNTASFTASNLAAYADKSPPRGTAKDDATILCVVEAGTVRNASTAVSSKTATAAMATRRHGTENFILLIVFLLVVCVCVSCVASAVVCCLLLSLLSEVRRLCLRRGLSAPLSSVFVSLKDHVPRAISMNLQTWQQIPTRRF